MKDTQTPRNWKTINLNTSNKLAIASGKNFIADLSDHYINYDYGSVVNLSLTNDATIKLNGSQSQPLPKGTEVTINRPFGSVEIINNGATELAIGEIQINYSFNSKKGEFINTGFKALPLLGLLRR